MNKSFIINVIKGIGVAIAVTLFLSLIQASVSAYILLSYGLTAFLSILITSFSIFAGAVYSAKKGRRKGYLSGLLIALFYMAFIFLYAKLNGNVVYFDLITAGRILLAVVIGLLSGMLGINL